MSRVHRYSRRGQSLVVLSGEPFRVEVVVVDVVSGVLASVQLILNPAYVTFPRHFTSPAAQVHPRLCPPASFRLRIHAQNGLARAPEAT